MAKRRAGLPICGLVGDTENMVRPRGLQAHKLPFLIGRLHPGNLNNFFLLPISASFEVGKKLLIKNVGFAQMLKYFRSWN